MILTIGNSGAYEFAAYSAVVQALTAKGKQAVLFRQDRCLSTDFLQFRAESGTCCFEVVIDDKSYNIDEFDTVWYLKPHLPYELLNYKPAEHRQFIHRQFYALRETLWTLCREKRWLNDPWSMYLAESKILQLQTAVRVGFTIPNTTITSDPNQVRCFYKDCEKRMVVKILSASPIPDKVIYTNQVTEADMERINSVRLSPSIFQQLIEKDHELRITVVGEKIFTVKIHSQEDSQTALDWRREPKLNDYKVRMEPSGLPEWVEIKIQAFMKAMNLRYGSIDMIVTPDGRYIFLEVNPNGQWYFIQAKTELKIAQAIADLLAP